MFGVQTRGRCCAFEEGMWGMYRKVVRASYASDGDLRDLTCTSSLRKTSGVDVHMAQKGRRHHF